MGRLSDLSPVWRPFCGGPVGGRVSLFKNGLLPLSPSRRGLGCLRVESLSPGPAIWNSVLCCACSYLARLCSSTSCLC